MTTDTGHARSAVRFFELLSAKDVETWADLWHPKARITVPYPADGFPDVIDGKDAILTGFRALFANFESFQAEITAVYQAGDSDAVVVEYRNEAMLKNGTRYTNDNIAVFRFIDGLVSEYHDYFDPRRFQVVVDALPADPGR